MADPGEILEAHDTSDDESVDDGGDVEDMSMECAERNELLHAAELLQRFSIIENDTGNTQSYDYSKTLILISDEKRSKHQSLELLSCKPILFEM